jgi:FAD:protein FMN transferase
MKYIIGFLFLACTQLSFSQSYQTEKEVLSDAGKLNRPILLVFSGSDWCLPCIRLEKQIFSDSMFNNFASKNLLLVKIDFPQKQKLSAEQTRLNEELAEKYNPKGQFPFILLLNTAGEVIATVNYEHYSPEAFIKNVEEILKSNNMLKEFSTQAKLMGCAFEFIVTAKTEAAGEELLNECIHEVKRIEKMLTEFNSSSETSRINHNAGIKPVTVTEETYGLIERSKNISKLTSGAFDITAGALKKLYNFKNCDAVVPTKTIIRDALAKTGYQKIRIQPPSTVFLAKAGMHIGFGAIGKGYAADKVKSLMESKGVEAGVINASGDLSVWGKRSNGVPWKAGIAHPSDRTKTIAWLPLEGLAMATSGNYEQFFMHDGQRFSHNIDPRTGCPVRGINSVTVISPSAELSDALATAVTVMGVKEGLDFINQLPFTWCIMADENNQLHCSRNITLHETKENA